jgi:hypothetical protein
MTNHPLFAEVTNVNLEFWQSWPLFSLQSLSIFINIAQIVHIEMSSYYFDVYKEDTLRNISMFLKQAHNLSSLGVYSSSSEYQIIQTFENMYPIIPRRLKHLHLPIHNLNQIKRILRKCEMLSTIKLETQLDFSKIFQWFNNNTINSSCWKGWRTITVWLGKKKIQQTRVQINNKRIKLTDDR